MKREEVEKKKIRAAQSTHGGQFASQALKSPPFCVLLHRERERDRDRETPLPARRISSVTFSRDKSDNDQDAEEERERDGRLYCCTPE